MVVLSLGNNADPDEMQHCTDPDEMQHCAAFHLGLHCLPVKGFPVYKVLIF